MALSNRDLLEELALAEHVGDVNNVLPDIAAALGEERPEWSDRKRRYVFPWEVTDAEGA